MKKSIKNNAENGTPIYAECGGLMYLTNSITYGKKKSKMVGLFDVDTIMTKKMTLNYTEGKINSNCLISKPRNFRACLLYTSPSPRDRTRSRMPSSA